MGHSSASRPTALTRDSARSGEWSVCSIRCTRFGASGANSQVTRIASPSVPTPASAAYEATASAVQLASDATSRW